jgi:hypothetical protein
MCNIIIQTIDQPIIQIPDLSQRQVTIHFRGWIESPNPGTIKTVRITFELIPFPELSFAGSQYASQFYEFTTTERTYSRTLMISNASPARTDWTSGLILLRGQDTAQQCTPGFTDFPIQFK